MIESGLLKYLKKNHGLNEIATFSDGAILNPVHYPLAGIKVCGAILFADLPSYSSFAQKAEPAECACYVNLFFAWFEGETKHFRGIVDKYIGDELMAVFIQSECKQEPLKAAILTAKAMLSNDPFTFGPKIGIAEGPFVVSLIGSTKNTEVSAMGNTVNLAARCTSETPTHSIRIAIDNFEFIKDIFTDHVWNVSEVKEIKPKNMKTVKVIDVVRESEFVRQFDFMKEIKKNVKFAENQGAIIKETK
jgi:class 3 adenylate cyclase